MNDLKAGGPHKIIDADSVQIKHLKYAEQEHVRDKMHCFRVEGHPNLVIYRHERLIDNEPRWGYGFCWRREDLRRAKTVEELAERVTVDTRHYQTAVTVFEQQGDKLTARQQFAATTQGVQDYHAFLRSLGTEEPQAAHRLGGLHRLMSLEDPE